MQALALVRRTLALALVIAACTPPVHAGHGGTSLDETSHTRASAPPVVPHTGVARPLTARGAALLEEPVAPALPAANADHSAAQELSPAGTEHGTPTPAPEHRGDKRERGKATTSATAHLHRPLTQRSKGASRNAPATPGMGLLLRIGTTAEREISMLIDDLSHAPIAPRSGRAPPLAASSASLASAFPPAASPSAATLPVERIRPLGAPALSFRTQPGALLPARERARRAARAARSRRRSRASFIPNARPRLVHARRPKGAAACPTPPFGGSAA